MLGFDCIGCGMITCECGERYKDWNTKRLEKFIATLQRILDGKKRKR